MRKDEELVENLDKVEQEIRQIYSEVEKILGRKPNVSDLPISLQPLFKKRRIIIAKLKKLGKYDEKPKSI